MSITRIELVFAMSEIAVLSFGRYTLPIYWNLGSWNTDAFVLLSLPPFFRGIKGETNKGIVCEANH